MTEQNAPAEQRTLFSRFIDRLSGRSAKAAATGERGVLMKLVGNRETVSIRRDIPAYLKAFNELPWLRTSITKIANSISSNDWDVLTVTEKHQANGETVIDEVETTSPLPIHAFLNNPNPNFSFQQLIWITQVYLELVGESAWWLQSISGELKAYPVPPDKLVRTPTYEDPFYHISGPQGEFTIPPEEIVYFSHPDPIDPYGRSCGLAQSLSHDLDTDDAASRYVLSYFNNRARPDLLIYGEGLNPERVRQMEDDWNFQNQGFWNAGKARFLSRKVEVKEISQKFEGGDIVKLRQNERDIVASVMGVPPEILGILQASNRATIDAADLFFSRYTLRPRLDFLQEILNKQLLPYFDDSGQVVMKYVNPVQKDMETILKAARFMPTALKIDDWRELMGFDPLDNDEGQCFILPMNMQVVGHLGSGTPPPATPPAAPEAVLPPESEEPAEPPKEPAAAAEAAYGKMETPFGTIKGRKLRSINELIDSGVDDGR